MAFIADYIRENSTYDVEYVKLDTGVADRDGRPPKYFMADYRDYHSYESNPHFCVHQGTASPASLLRKLHWAHQHRTPTKIFIFEARNISQCKLFLINRGWSTGDNRPAQNTIALVQERIMITNTEREIQRLELQAQAALDRAQYLRSLPSEPKKIKKSTEPRANVIYFRRTFAGSDRQYTYAAVKTAQGWYTTGPRTPKAFTWRELIAWINAEGPQPVWQARSFEVLTSSNPIITAGTIDTGQNIVGTLPGRHMDGGVR